MTFQTTHKLGLVLLLAIGASACGSSGNSVSNLGNKAQDVGGKVDVSVSALAEQCGIDVSCKGGIVAGNASISGVTSVDAFFQSVINFQTGADNASASIDAQLDAIAGEFGIAADADAATELEAQFTANLEGGVHLRAEPAHCSIDTQATIAAQARCDTTIEPAKVSCKCRGRCQVEASANVKCEASAELKCTVTPPKGACEGTCQGSCDVKLKAEASCDGTCRGSCAGNCSAFSDDKGTQCAGRCDGMCTGSCESELMVEASCSGSCNGECTIAPPDGNCEGSAHASCDSMADAMVDCRGRCEGEIEVPKAKAECEASARAEAKLNVECTPPRVVLDYTFKADIDADARARFEVALNNMRARLPALLATVGRAQLAAQAGEGLSVDASDAVHGAVDAAVKGAGKADLRVYFGLRCALKQLDDVDAALADSSDRLNASLSAAADVQAMIGAEKT